VAGIVEGFVTGSGTGLTGALAVGFALGLLYWTLVVLLGRASRGLSGEWSPVDDTRHAPRG
jgi:hypothetical protein